MVGTHRSAIGLGKDSRSRNEAGIYEEQQDPMARKETCALAVDVKSLIGTAVCDNARTVV